jgi:membrane-associated phospholipid phosphatase
MRKLFFRSDFSLNLYYLFLIIGITIFYLYGKEESYHLMNRFHSKGMDEAMKIITFLGDGLFLAIFGLIFIFFRIRIAIFVTAAWMFSGLIAQIFKRFVFPDELRPHGYFSELGIEIYRITGIDIHINHSFPSGHSATSFAVFLGLSFFVKNKYLKLALIFLACLTAFSRVYLGQHFLSDILAGSALGVLTSVILYKFVIKLKKPWLDMPLQKILQPGK